MSRFIQLEDFEKGELSIQETIYGEGDLQEVIDKQEKSVLVDLLGHELYLDFIADWDNAPAEEFSEARFKTIYDELYFVYCGHQLESIGIKEILKHVVFYEYMRRAGISKNTNGFCKIIDDNSKPLSGNGAGIYEYYNKGIRSYDAIQLYIGYNPESYDYKKYLGEHRQKAGWL